MTRPGPPDGDATQERDSERRDRPSAGPRPRSTLWVGTALADVGGADPTHRAIVTSGSTILWTGQPEDAPPVEDVVDLGTAWLTPGFVDAHVHGTATGMLQLGLDLTDATSAADVLRRVRDHALRAASADDAASEAVAVGRPVIYGAGWDDLRWPDGRPSPEDLQAAARGAMVVLVRIDGHSCLVDATTLRSLDLRSVAQFVDTDEEGNATGWLKEDASGVALEALRASTSQRHTVRARDAAARLAISRGVTTIHEMGIPELSERSDALAWALGDHPTTVHAYWATMDIDPDSPLLPGGDLFLDGSIGSCTAATAVPYTAGTGELTSGALFHDDDTVTDFFIRATRAGLGAGVHAIGDLATAQALRALVAAGEVCGVDAVRAARHRIEHAEMIARTDVRAMAALGVVASVQPAFDAVWNGPAGLYEHRFGRTLADTTNPFGWFAEEGVTMCFSSDSTVTPIDPWGGVAAAEAHQGGLGVSRRTALAAATIGGSRARCLEDDVGPIRPGFTADVVAWPTDPVTMDLTATSTPPVPVAVISRGLRRDGGATPPQM